MDVLVPIWRDRLTLRCDACHQTICEQCAGYIDAPRSPVPEGDAKYLLSCCHVIITLPECVNARGSFYNTASLVKDQERWRNGRWIDGYQHLRTCMRASQ